MRYCIVIGHSSKSPGATNKSYNLSEFEFNEMLAYDIQDRIDDSDLMILYRQSSIENLVKEINNLNPLFAVELHCNAFNETASGTETLYWHTSEKGKEISEIFQSNIIKALGLNNRGTKAIVDGQRGWYILKNTKMPVIITEPFFIDNKYDLKEVKENYDLFVNAFIEAIKQTKILLGD